MGNIISPVSIISNTRGARRVPRGAWCRHVRRSWCPSPCSWASRRQAWAIEWLLPWRLGTWHCPEASQLLFALPLATPRGRAPQMTALVSMRRVESHLLYLYHRAQVQWVFLIVALIAIVCATCVFPGCWKPGHLPKAPCITQCALLFQTRSLPLKACIKMLILRKIPQRQWATNKIWFVCLFLLTSTGKASSNQIIDLQKHQLVGAVEIWKFAKNI